MSKMHIQKQNRNDSPSIFYLLFTRFYPRASRLGQAPLEAARARSVPLPLMGQAALSMVLLIGGILVLVGLSLIFLSNSFLNFTQGYRLAQRAQTVAASGVQDAMIQLVRNKDFSSVGYSVAVGSSTATVVVTQDSPATGEAVITSTATVSSYKRTIRSIVSRNASTSQIIVLSWVQT